MTEKNSEEFLVLAPQDQELKRFFDQVRVSGKLVVKDGADEFVVELRRQTITKEARKHFTGGGPA